MGKKGKRKVATLTKVGRTNPEAKSEEETVKMKTK